ncbi:MAG: hypothetical protein ACKN9T_04225 [Candidatus Methylumidiphilus sp.]
MNPLLYKAHPLLFLTIDVFANPAAHPWRESGRLLLIYLAANLAWAGCLAWVVRRLAGFVPSMALLGVLALPATLLYLPAMLTLLADVLAHSFQLADRFILAFSVLTASQMLAALYAVAIRYPNGSALGLIDGLSVSLTLWLASLPVCLALLWLETVWKLA